METKIPLKYKFTFFKKWEQEVYKKLEVEAENENEAYQLIIDADNRAIEYEGLDELEYCVDAMSAIVFEAINLKRFEFQVAENLQDEEGIEEFKKALQTIIDSDLSENQIRDVVAILEMSEPEI